METVEIYEHSGEVSKQLCVMYFRNETDLWQIAGNILATSFFNSLRNGRHDCFSVKIGSITYYTDELSLVAAKICREYNRIYARAEELAKARAWWYAWSIAGEKWKRMATLRQMGKARKLLEKEAAAPEGSCNLIAY